MLHSLLDVLACPVDGVFPMALTVGRKTINMQPHKQPRGCRLFCALGKEQPALTECVDCHQQEVIEGTLLCPACGEEFQIIEGIPDLIRPGFLLDSATAQEKDQRQEMATRDMMAARYDAQPPMRWTARFEIPGAVDILEKGSCDRAIDLGCGTGRPTAEVARWANSLIAVDYSMDSLRISREKLAGSPHVQFVRAEISRLPVRDGAVDTAVSFEVFEHLPSDELRRRAVAEAARVLTGAGRFIISAYRESWFSRILGKKESYHFGGIYYFRFTPTEFEEMLKPYFEMDVYHPRMGGLVQMAGCLKVDAVDTGEITLSPENVTPT